MPSPSSTEFLQDHNTCCTWWNRMQTKLPFITKSWSIHIKTGNLGIGVYSAVIHYFALVPLTLPIQDPDIRMVQWAARCSLDTTVASDLGDPRSLPMVEVLDDTSDMSDKEMAFKIHASLGSGRAVLVINYNNTDSRTLLQWNGLHSNQAQWRIEQWGWVAE